MAFLANLILHKSKHLKNVFVGQKNCFRDPWGDNRASWRFLPVAPSERSPGQEGYILGIERASGTVRRGFTPICANLPARSRRPFTRRMSGSRTSTWISGHRPGARARSACRQPGKWLRALFLHHDVRPQKPCCPPDGARLASADASGREARRRCPWVQWRSGKAHERARMTRDKTLSDAFPWAECSSAGSWRQDCKGALRGAARRQSCRTRARLPMIVNPPWRSGPEPGRKVCWPRRPCHRRSSPSTCSPLHP